MKKARISIESGELTPNDGLIKVWWWKEGFELNQKLKAKKPIWEILNAHQTFLLCTAGDVLEVDEKIMLKHFEVVQ